MALLELLLSLIVIPILGLLTILVRRILLGLYATGDFIIQEEDQTNRSEKRRKEIQRGRIGVSTAVLGYYLPVFLFFCFLNHQARVLDNPTLDDWIEGPGWFYVHLCEWVIFLCEIIAVGFGILSWRTAFGWVTFVISAAFIFMTWFRLENWYMCINRF